ncbi:DNA repair protein Rad60 [Cydia pomonella]|uniref:DNA repair protein Rad60 n=1 Tax=Cydia pomonella TaxID=82600 RepID=UPI002ADDFD50|nr:DNA repair protein Rad60 [Cydia pomonella]
MSSSDSEDDSFLNPTQQLKSMMNNFKADTDCNLNDSIPLDIVPTTSPSKSKKTKNKSPSKKRKKSTDSCSSDSITIEDFCALYPPINDARPKRNTRSSAKRTAGAQNSPNLADIQKSLPKRKSKKSNISISSTTTMDTEMAGNSSRNVEIELPSPSPRGRGRGRGRGRNSRNKRHSRNYSGAHSILNVLQAMIPIYSVGNTDEYPDQCDDQQLFSNQKSSDVVEIEDLNETLEENELMSVKVEWRSKTILKFELRKYQKLTPIFEHFSKAENVSYDKLYFSYNGKIIKPEDTPDSIEYSIAKFIDGGIVSQSVVSVSSNENEIRNGIKLKFQCQNVKKPFEIIVGPEDKMAMAMLRCAEHFEKPFEKLKFEFDGDIISGKNTPRELDLEGGGCIDVKILN